MFKQIDEIPKSRYEKFNTVRRSIDADIRDAEAQGILKFEFVGDYNFKTLHQTAREEADKLNRQAYMDYRRAKLAEDPELKNVKFDYWDKTIARKYKVSSIKDGEIRRVFCEIVPDALNTSWEAAYETYLAKKALKQMGGMK